MRPIPYPSPSITDTDDLAPQFDPFYLGPDRPAGADRRLRIRVRSVWSDDEEYVRTGVVGRSTGWRPVYLLLPRRDSSGSADVLEAEDQIIGVETFPGSSVYEPLK